MRFVKAEPDRRKGLYCRHVSENGLVEIGVFRVLYGFRIRAGFTSNKTNSRTDWCCGADWILVQAMYTILFSILELREENETCFEGIPRYSEIKPCYKDPEFQASLKSLAPRVSLVAILLDPREMGSSLDEAIAAGN